MSKELKNINNDEANNFLNHFKKGAEAIIRTTKGINKTFTFFAIKEKNGKFNHFYKEVHPAICALIGKKADDFLQVEVVIEDEIDLTRDAHFYDGTLCGFYDFLISEDEDFNKSRKTGI